MFLQSMKNASYLLLILLISACGKPSDLQSKKEELAAYKEEADRLKGLISKLEKEIALLDTAAIAEQPKLVALETISAADFNHYIDLQGTVESEDHIAVQPGIPGLVTKVLVREGDRVSQGQIMAEPTAGPYVRALRNCKPILTWPKRLLRNRKDCGNRKSAAKYNFCRQKRSMNRFRKVFLQPRLNST